jgi:hypothetical protein
MARSESGTLTRRQRSLVRALRPGVARLREFILARGSLSEPLKRAFREWNLDTNNDTDWKVLAWLLADQFFDEGKLRGRRAWDASQLHELLFEVQKRKHKNPRLSDQKVCERIAKDKNSPPYFRVGLRGAEGSGLGLVKRLRDARRYFQRNSLARAAFPLAFGRI